MLRVLWVDVADSFGFLGAKHVHDVHRRSSSISLATILLQTIVKHRQWIVFYLLRDHFQDVEAHLFAIRAIHVHVRVFLGFFHELVFGLVLQNRISLLVGTFDRVLLSVIHQELIVDLAFLDRRRHRILLRLKLAVLLAGYEVVLETAVFGIHQYQLLLDSLHGVPVDVGFLQAAVIEMLQIVDLVGGQVGNLCVHVFVLRAGGGDAAVVRDLEDWLHLFVSGLEVETPLQIQMHCLLMKIPQQLASISYGLLVVVSLRFAWVSLTDMASEGRSYLEHLVAKLAGVGMSLRSGHLLLLLVDSVELVR